MEIALIVLFVILVNTFFLNVIDKLLCMKPNDFFQAWFFSVPIFIFCFIALCGKLFGKLLHSLDKFANK